jgi:phosphate transport system substrate-binding protein
VTRRMMIVALALVASVALLGSTAQAAGGLKITGSTTVLPIAKKCVEVFKKKHPNVVISLSGTGSGDGIRSIIDGTADIGDASRDMKAKEIAMAKKKGVTPVRHVIAMDCIVPIVHPGNKVSNLTIAQLNAIYTGKITNWKQLGWKNRAIVVLSRDSSSGTFEVWNHKVLKKAHLTKRAQLLASNGAVKSAVAANRYAIGYVGIGYVGRGVKPVKVNGVMATPAGALKGTYPIARKLFMFTRGQPTGIVKAFIDFVKSKKGQKLVKAAGFVPLH